MPSSRIVTIAPKDVPDQAGFVLLGTIDGVAYLHVAPQPDDPSWMADAEVLYDPTPDPFRWDDFAEEFPELAASPGTDAEGAPLPPVLMVHSWLGE
jgi:hypothetical protein